MDLNDLLGDGGNENESVFSAHKITLIFYRDDNNSLCDPDRLFPLKVTVKGCGIG